MDVQCERCKTEYEFDDALVSGRGTTVRCTNCGHQFKVRRSEPDGLEEAGNDRWGVRTAAGQQFTFVTLRELQRAILSGQVTRTDQLRRSGAPARSLGSISELEPFFQGRTSSRPPPPGPAPSGDPSTVPVAFPKRSSITWEDAASAPRAQPQRPEDFAAAPASPMRRKVDTLRPPLSAAAAPPPAALAPPPRMSTPAAAPQQPSVPTRPTPAHAPIAPEKASVMGRTQVLPVVMAPVSAAPPAAMPAATRPVRRAAPPVAEEYPEMRNSIPSSMDEPFSAPRGRRVGGWIVALVLMLAVAVVGWAVAKPYLVGRNAQAEAQLDPRAQSFLAEGEKAMNDGNLDVAQQALDKASALAEADPRVLLDVARVAAAEADVPWLKIRLLPPEAADELRTTKAQVEERVTRARRTADAALAGAPEDPSAVRARIDSLRLAGEQDSARAYVAKVIAQASQPETAYVLAALDLAEPEPLWKTVIERLRLAAAGEGNAGRARAALVYALAKSGDTPGARAELAKLDALTRPYPILPNLHALVEKALSKSVPDAGAPATVSSSRAAASGAVPQAAALDQPTTGSSPAAGDAVPSDPRVAMQMAVLSVKKGELVRARQIYESVVAHNPSDSEALAGLGDIARLDGDPGLAILRYKRAIAVNPSYLPALLGLADTQWSSGDHAGAARGYTEIVDRFPEGTYPSFVKQRSEAGGNSASPAPTTTTKSAPSSTPAGARPE